jgi:hypothetical protein
MRFATAETRPAKAPLRLLIQDLRGNARSGDPAGLLRRHFRGLRTAEFSGANWYRTGG